MTLSLVRDKWQDLTSRADINVIIADIAKVGLAELPFGLHACCHRLGQRRRDIGLAAFEDLLGAEVASISKTLPTVTFVPSILDDKTASCVVSGESKTCAFGIAESNPS